MSRARAKEMRLLFDRCRELWSEFDPIGVMDDEDCPRDEYDTYLPLTIKHAVLDADLQNLTAYLRHVILEEMGLVGFYDEEIEKFANRLLGEFGA